MQGLTAQLISRVLPLRCSELPDDVRRVAQDCLLDWLACTYAGLPEPAAQLVTQAALDEGGHPRATFVGRGAKGSAAQAALVNGTASHALDYDDVNLAVPGHMTVAIFPALLALAEEHGRSGADVLAAFVAGYETACRIGKLVEPAHYANGFHATVTIGSLGAAVACSHLLRLSPEQAAHAVGVAATQAAGLKAMFGTMAKPLHAGLAAQSGVRAALLARNGFTSRTDAIECTQGFAQVHGTGFDVPAALSEPAGGYHLLANLFKFHAACYSTHSTIDALAELRHAHGLLPDAVRKIDVVAGEGCSICNIQSPTTALEAKFSLRAAAALALLDRDTSGLDVWAEATAPEVVALRDRVTVTLVPGMSLSESEVTVRLIGGTEHRLHFDSGIPMADKTAQSVKVEQKFQALTKPIMGAAKSAEILGLLREFEQQPDCRVLGGVCGALEDGAR